MNPLTKKLLLLASISIVAIASIIIVLIAPLRSQIEIKKKTLDKERSETVLITEQQKNLQITRAEYERISVVEKEINAYYLTDTTILTFISSIEDIAKAMNVTHEFQDFQTPAAGSKTSTMNVAVSGTMDQLLGYLASLEKLPIYTNIETVTLHPLTPNDAGQSIISLTYDALLYWL